MNILNLEKITKAYGVRKILDETDFYLEEGEKVGILGINGTGKSTLLKIIAGLEEADFGKVTKAENYMIRFLPQTPKFKDDQTVLEAVLEGNEHLEVEAKTMLTKLGVYDFTQPCGQLSGGQKKRLALVAVLMSDAEIVILDEPTNHLDHEMSEWLEEMLKKRKGAVVMVTHDRYFLDSVSTRIVELSKGKLYSYDSNYSGYLELKLQREEMELSTQKKRKNILRNELAWVRRGAQARSTKQKARLQRFEEMSQIEDIEVQRNVQLASVAFRLGRTTVELNNLSKSYDGKTIIKDFTYLFLKSDRVGFVGPNGSGKSTLMKMITGDVKPDSGTVEIGQTVKIGYYAQELDDTMMNPNKRVIDYIRDVAEYIETPDGKVTAARMLENFLFEGEDQYGLLGKLSGGERRRLYLCKVLMTAPNVLILDEPTNDLDIATLQILEDYLDTFSGIVAIVSHDRYFLDRAVQRIFALEENGTVVQYEGGYTDYVNRLKENGKTTTGAISAGKNEKAATLDGVLDGTVGEKKVTGANWKADQKKKLKFTYQEQKDYEKIESEIATLEEKIEKLDQEYSKCGTDFVKLNQIMQEKEKLEGELEEKMDRWMYLEDLAARIEKGEWV